MATQSVTTAIHEQLLENLTLQADAFERFYRHLEQLLGATVESRFSDIDKIINSLALTAGEYESISSTFLRLHRDLSLSCGLKERKTLTFICQEFDVPGSSEILKKTRYLKKMREHFSPLIEHKVNVLREVSVQIASSVEFLRSSFCSDRTYSPYGKIRGGRLPEGIRFQGKV